MEGHCSAAELRQLPPELWCEIFTLLSTAEGLGVASFVCRQWRLLFLSRGLLRFHFVSPSTLVLRQLKQGTPADSRSKEIEGGTDDELPRNDISSQMKIIFDISSPMKMAESVTWSRGKNFTTASKVSRGTATPTSGYSWRSRQGCRLLLRRTWQSWRNGYQNRGSSVTGRDNICQSKDTGAMDDLSCSKRFAVHVQLALCQSPRYIQSNTLPR